MDLHSKPKGGPLGKSVARQHLDVALLVSRVLSSRPGGWKKSFDGVVRRASVWCIGRVVAGSGRYWCEVIGSMRIAFGE